jgi:hypothetical protein
MKLNIIIDEYSMDLEVADDYIERSGDAFDSLDHNMDTGWQMGRQWVANPNREERCQIAAVKLLNAIETDNEGLAMVAGGYILTRLPGVKSVMIDTSGEPLETEFIMQKSGLPLFPDD